MIRKALLVGLGSIGLRHLRLLREALPEADIRVLRHTNTAESNKDPNGFFFRLEDACSFAPELAVIANPSPFHIVTAMALAETGAHLLVEKPLSPLSDGAEEGLTTAALRFL
ncbi:MAG: Gfo/Idh/MocA family oxidoreductase, partial [Alphaproteobacteria bacterium]